MNKSEIKYFIALSAVKGITFKAAKLLTDKYGSAEALFECDKLSIPNEEGEDTPVNLFTKQSKEELLCYANKEIEFVEKNNIKVLPFCNNSYPQALSECHDAPILLYTLGNINLNEGKYVSVIGTRHPSSYGREWCEKFVSELSEMFPDIVIVSGLAYGIDVCAHRTALECGIKTAAVLGTPLNSIYPATHRECAKNISENGVLISEYSTQSPTLRVNFASRNRIVAGMSSATVVVESKESGGSLITASLASGYYRDVFALPGDITRETSTGCNNLIRDNKAQLITSAKDFISAMGWEYMPASKRVQTTLFPDLDQTETIIVDILKQEGECHIGRIGEISKLPTSMILSTLMGLEFKGIIKSYPGNRYKSIL